jgi:serine/threonine protein phosphatase 1
MMQRDFLSAIEKLNALNRQPIDKKGRAFFVPKGRGRRLIVSDIHGCYQTFLKLMQKVEFEKADQLFILGDMVDRAPHSLSLLEHITGLLNEGYQIYPLRGNHEQLFIDFATEEPQKLRFFAERQNAQHLLQSNRNLSPELMEWFMALPYYYELDKAYLVHAGFATSAKKPFKSWHEMLWLRKFEYQPEIYQKKFVIHGHVPVPYPMIEKRLKQLSGEIFLDNGCVRSRVTNYGKMICLDLDKMEIISQKNIDLVPA